MSGDVFKARLLGDKVEGRLWWAQYLPSGEAAALYEDERSRISIYVVPAHMVERVEDVPEGDGALLRVSAPEDGRALHWIGMLAIRLGGSVVGGSDRSIRVNFRCGGPVVTVKEADPIRRVGR
jgi:hypothetical protein